MLKQIKFIHISANILLGCIYYYYGSSQYSLSKIRSDHRLCSLLFLRTFLIMSVQSQSYIEF